MSEIAVFNFEEQEVRTITDEHGAPWFVARDVATVLGYANTNEAVSRHCKGVAKCYPLQTPGGVQQLRVIGEPDLYRLIASFDEEG
ncbi:MAG: Bro-N domain-containing protein [Desulfobulbus sp.]|jgi:prophage antirepressor-like protein